MKDALRDIRVHFLQLGKDAGHRCPLGFSVDGTGGLHHGKFQGFLHMLYMAFGKINQGADHGDSRAAHTGAGMEGVKAAFVEEREQQGFHRVVPVMPEGELVAAQLHAGVGQNGAPHLCAECAGILFLPVVEDDVPDLGFFDQIGDFQRFTQRNDRGKIHGTQKQ